MCADVLPGVIVVGAMKCGTSAVHDLRVVAQERLAARHTEEVADDVERLRELLGDDPAEWGAR